MFYSTVHAYFVVISVNVRGLFCWGVCTGLSARYLDIKKDKTIFRMAEYKVSLKYDIFICRLLSYLCLKVCDLIDNVITVLWSDILSIITILIIILI